MSASSCSGEHRSIRANRRAAALDQRAGRVGAHDGGPPNSAASSRGLAPAARSTTSLSSWWARNSAARVPRARPSGGRSRPTAARRRAAAGSRHPPGPAGRRPSDRRRPPAGPSSVGVSPRQGSARYCAGGGAAARKPSSASRRRWSAATCRRCGVLEHGVDEPDEVLALMGDGDAVVRHRVGGREAVGASRRSGPG